MACNCRKRTNYRFELTRPDGSKETFDTRRQAVAAKARDGGSIRRVT